MKKTIFLAGLLSFIVACSKEKSDENIGTNNQPATISMKNSVFSPDSLVVSVNSTVTWINDDDMVHTVTADNGSFNSGDIAPGSRFTYTFSNAGTYNYHCMHHSGMTGVVMAGRVK